MIRIHATDNCIDVKKTVFLTLYMVVFALCYGFGSARSCAAENDLGCTLKDTQSKSRQAPGFHVLRFTEPVKSQWMDAIRNIGITVLEPLPPYGFMVWLHHGQDRDLHSFENIDSILPLYSDKKLADSLHALKAEILLPISLWILDQGSADDVSGRIRSAGGSAHYVSRIWMSDRVSYVIVNADMDAGLLWDIAETPSVRWIYPRSTSPGFEDELPALEIIQDPFRDHFIPGYIAHLGEMGLTGNSITIGLIDSGFDTGSNDTCHPDLRGRIDRFIFYPGSPVLDAEGHGTHMGGILAGNGRSGRQDMSGFNYGIGIAPRAELVVSNALTANPFPPENGYAGMIRDIADTGTSLCSNSWWDREGVGIGYTANCAIWDAAVRDAVWSDHRDAAHPMTIFFSAGNFGPGPGTISSPKEAKNIITTSACGSIRAGESFELWSQSSRGPCLDGRNAPTISAPGIGIYSCWPINGHKPLTGTSAATPHVTGIGALLSEYCHTNFNHIPSPALLRAMIVSLAEPKGELFPDPGWGWGRLAMKDLRSTEFSWIDQSEWLLDTGDIYTGRIAVDDMSKPLDIIVAWTDPPAGPGSNPALVNDLDLSVVSSGQEYTGNHFNGFLSVPGGSPDRLNNLERIILEEPGTYCTFAVKAENIPGDGIPGNDLPQDQDFVLLVRNGHLQTDGIELRTDKLTCACDDRLSITLSGSSLSGSGIQTIRIRTAGDSNGFDMVLHEHNDASGLFRGILYVESEQQRDPSVTVFPGDLIFISYETAESQVFRSVTVDGTPAFLNDYDIHSIGADQTTITISTSEDTMCTLLYRQQGTDDWKDMHSEWFDTVHEWVMKPLDACTWYDVKITSRDLVGNRISYGEPDGFTSWITDSREIIYTCAMDTDPFWPEMDGEWAWGDPAANGSPPDPDTGYSGSHVLGYNLNGNYTNHMDAMHAVSPVFDCSESGDYTLSYHRWLGTESGYIDRATVSVRTIENNWVTVWQNPALFLYDGAWISQSHDVSFNASKNPEFQFRFTQGPTNIVDTACGWNIDDVSLSVDRPCVDPTPTPLPFRITPEFQIAINNKVFHPGDRMQVYLSIHSPDGFSHAGFALELQVDDNKFYYPGWTQLMDYSVIEFPGKGIHRYVLVDLKWPTEYVTDTTLIFTGALFDPDTYFLWGSLKHITCRFLPN
jgi:subtilisin family serine protease